jgi:hypothetical protein
MGPRVDAGGHEKRSPPSAGRRVSPYRLRLAPPEYAPGVTRRAHRSRLHVKAANCYEKIKSNIRPAMFPRATTSARPPTRSPRNSARPAPVQLLSKPPEAMDATAITPLEHRCRADLPHRHPWCGANPEPRAHAFAQKSSPAGSSRPPQCNRLPDTSSHAGGITADPRRNTKAGRPPARPET